MDDAQLGAFVDGCLERLQQKQTALSARGVGNYERFEVDLANGKLRFYDGARLALEADVTPIGTHVSENESWQWAWANKSFPDTVRERAAKLKELAAQTTLAAFSERTLEVDEAQTWQLVAMACEHLGALGTYDFPTRSARLYVAIHGFDEIAGSVPTSA
ncbi:MAG TPA: hypothetical protein VNG33_00365 [Polyangiaceae bacterium]|nr:hypothetical protein [Polyangiaceae bacterium]